MTGGSNGNHSGPTYDGEPIEPDLLAIARRLDHDGDTWRRGLPDEAQAARRAIAAISSVAPMAPAQSSARRVQTRREVPSSEGPRLNQPRQSGPRRAQRLLAVAAMLAVVILLAALLKAFAPRQAGPHPTATATPSIAPTATGFPGAWTIAFTAQAIPVFAPSDPRVVYVVQMQTPGKPGPATTSVTLQRSDDAGKTWHTLALPSGLVVDNNLLDLHLVVSPVDSQVVFLYSARSAAACASAPGGVCLTQYSSGDGGASWALLPLPLPGIIAQVVATAGGMLYALVAQPTYSSGVGPPGRLIASADGGLTWHVADAALWAQGDGIVSMAASPQAGTSMWAITLPVALWQSPQAAYQLWRSDDGGATWRLALNGALPYQYSATLIAGAGALYQIASPAGSSGQTLADQLPAVSTDGGATWTKPPTAGLPEDVSVHIMQSIYPVVAGSAIIVHISDGDAIAFYAWQPGAASWTEVAPPLVVGQFKGLVAVVDGGRTTLWALFAKVGIDGLAVAWFTLG